MWRRLFERCGHEKGRSCDRPFERCFSQRAGLSGRGGFASGGRGLRHGEAETDFATLGGGAGLATGALFRGLVSTQAADFFKDALHFETGLEALESAVNGFAFADLDFGHNRFWGGWEKGGKSRGRIAGVKWNIVHPNAPKPAYPSTSRITCPCTSVSRRSMPLL